MMNKQKLYISDLDGTLLNSDARLSRVSAQILRDMLSQGLQFSVATLRSYHSIKPLFAGIKLAIPVIELNGAMLVDLTTGEKLCINAISPAARQGIYKAICNLQLSPVILTYHNGRDCLYFNRLNNPGMQWYYLNRRDAGDRRLKRYTSVEDLLPESWVGITVIDRVETLTSLMIELESRFAGLLNIKITESHQTPGHPWLTINSVRASKSEGIKALKNDFAFANHQIICFGDQPVDLSMFEVADLSVAVANAHPDVKAAADLVIGNHNTDAVVKYIRDDFLGILQGCRK